MNAFHNSDMNKTLIYLVGPSTSKDVERIRQVLPEANIELIPRPGKAKKPIKAGAIGVVVLDDYIGVGKEVLLIRTLWLKPSKVMGLNEEGNLVLLSKFHIRQLFINSIRRALVLPLRFIYVCVALLWPRRPTNRQQKSEGIYKEMYHEHNAMLNIRDEVVILLSGNGYGGHKGLIT